MSTDLNKISSLAVQIEKTMRDVPCAVDVINDSAQRDPEIRAVVDRQRLADLNVSATTVATAMRTAVGGTVVTQMRPEGEDQVDILVRASDSDRVNAASLGALTIQSAAGQPVRLAQ